MNMTSRRGSGSGLSGVGLRLVLQMSEGDMDWEMAAVKNTNIIVIWSCYWFYFLCLIQTNISFFYYFMGIYTPCNTWSRKGSLSGASFRQMRRHDSSAHQRNLHGQLSISGRLILTWEFISTLLLPKSRGAFGLAVLLPILWRLCDGLLMAGGRIWGVRTVGRAVLRGNLADARDLSDVTH